MILVFLHGFGSTGEGSRTAQAFKDYFTNHIVLTPTYDSASPIRASFDFFHQISPEMQKYPTAKVVFVGTSLGGFWARMLCRMYADRSPTLVMINPALEPWEGLKKHIGINENFVTGEEFTVTEDDIMLLPKYAIVEDAELPILLFTSDNDDLVPPELARNTFRGRAQLVNFAMGGHRMEGKLEDIIELTDVFISHSKNTA